MLHPGPPRLAVDAQPDFERVLGREAVEAKGGKQTHDTAGYEPGDLGNVASFGDQSVGVAIEPARHPLDHAARAESRDLRPRQARRFKVA